MKELINKAANMLENTNSPKLIFSFKVLSNKNSNQFNCIQTFIQPWIAELFVSYQLSSFKPLFKITSIITKDGKRLRTKRSFSSKPKSANSFSEVASRFILTSLVFINAFVHW